MMAKEKTNETGQTNTLACSFQSIFLSVTPIHARDLIHHRVIRRDDLLQLFSSCSCAYSDLRPTVPYLRQPMHASRASRNCRRMQRVDLRAIQICMRYMPCKLQSNCPFRLSACSTCIATLQLCSSLWPDTEHIEIGT